MVDKNKKLWYNVNKRMKYYEETKNYVTKLLINHYLIRI